MTHPLLTKSSYSTLKTNNGVTYSYYLAPAKPGRPTILYLHGFPDDASGWLNAVIHFESLGYGSIAPDLLGYGSTDKPSDAQEYRLKKMAESVSDIVRHSGVDKVVVAAHDW